MQTLGPAWKNGSQIFQGGSGNLYFNKVRGPWFSASAASRTTWKIPGPGSPENHLNQDAWGWCWTIGVYSCFRWF